MKNLTNISQAVIATGAGRLVERLSYVM